MKKEKKSERLRVSPSELELINESRSETLKDLSGNTALDLHLKERGILKQDVVSVKHWQNMGGELRFSIVTKQDQGVDENKILDKIKELIARYEADVERNITDRWQSDMNSDSWLSKHVRPAMLVFLVVATIVMVFIDSGNINFAVEDKWVDLLQLVLITVIGAYFGGRTLEKRNNN